MSLFLSNRRKGCISAGTKKAKDTGCQGRKEGYVISHRGDNFLAWSIAEVSEEVLLTSLLRAVSIRWM